MKLHLLNCLVEDAKRFQDIKVLNYSVYERFNVYIESKMRESPKIRAAPVQVSKMLTELGQQGKRPTAFS